MQIHRDKIAIATGADANYFAFLEDLVASTASFFREHELALYVLDFGLSDGQREQLKDRYPYIVYLHGTEAFLDKHGIPHGTHFYRILLPEMLPNHDVYMWIDCDIWFQDPKGIDAYLTAASRHEFAITPELDRSYINQYYPEEGNIHEWVLRLTTTGFGAERAQAIHDRPLINAGMFAMRKDCWFWESWLRYVIEGTANGLESDQPALNLAIYESRRLPHFLPAAYNWMCNRTIPRLNGLTGVLEHPQLPHEPLVALHLAGGARKFICTFENPQGRALSATLRYRDIRRVVETIRTAERAR